VDEARIEAIARCLTDLGACWLAFRPAELVMSLGHLPCWGASACVWGPDGSATLFVPELEPGDTLPEGVTCHRFPWGVMTCSDPWSVLLRIIREDARARGILDLPLATRRHAPQTALARTCAESPPFDDSFPERLAGEVFGGALWADAELNTLFVIKTAEEVRRIERANEVAAAGIDAFHQNLREGISEARLAAEIESTIMAQMERPDIGSARAWAMVQSGPECARGGTYSRTTGRSMGDGDGVFLELATCVDGYYSDLTRVGCVGMPTAEWKETLAAVQQAQRLAIGQIRPGVACSDVDDAARRHLAKHGLGDCFTHLIGHQVGFHYHDPGPVLAPGSSASLEAGMIVTVEPGVYKPQTGIGIRIEDNVLVTETGFRVLSTAATGGWKEAR
jgi:Xaa-Pro dipeptidase